MYVYSFKYEEQVNHVNLTYSIRKTLPRYKKTIELNQNKHYENILCTNNLGRY